MNTKEVIKPTKGATSKKGSNASGGKPPPPKRSFTEVSPNSSVEEISVINHHLDELSDDIQHMRDDLKQVLKKDEMKEFIQKTINETINELNKNIEATIAIQVDKMTKSLQDRISSLEDDNSALKKEIKTIKQSIKENDRQSKDALARANYNEQYSRKNNIKIMDIQEKTDEKEAGLLKTVSSILQKDGITIDNNKVMAIHRIPGKRGHQRPVLIKFTNNSEKARVMTHRKGMKALGHRLVDDVTKLNVDLLKRLSSNPRIESTWYFNGFIYGKTKEGIRHRFDIFDNINETITKPTNRPH